jgi:pimeloyl-ACP methyl ester carboxylesterase
MYGGRTPEGKVGFTGENGPFLDRLLRIQPSPLLNGEELDFYVKEFSRHGMNGPLNWYRNRRIAYEEELALLDNGRSTHKFKIPVLFIAAMKDTVLKPEMSAGLEKFCDNLTRGEVKASHWALTQTPCEVNEILRGWLSTQGLVPEKASL